MIVLLFCFIVVGYSDPEWKLGVSVWEWHRWLSFVEPNVKTTVIGVDFSYFPPRVWKEVFELCSKHGYECRIETQEEKKKSIRQKITEKCKTECRDNWAGVIGACWCHGPDHMHELALAKYTLGWWNEKLGANITEDPHPGKSTVYIEEK